MTAVFLSGRKRICWIAFIFAILMAISRIYLVVHFASDVVAGILVGVLSGIIGTFLAKKIPAPFYNSSWPFKKKIELSSD
jgi:undecaprenyl-diphosphatase